VPHHVPAEWVAKYRGKFDQGWDKLRAESFARQKELGVIPANAELTPRPKDIPEWDSMTADEKRLVSRQMEVYAGFLEQTDYEVGRLLDAVKAQGHDQDTAIFYIPGDNGASAEGGFEGHDGVTAEGKDAPLAERLQHVDDLGGEMFMNHYATARAWALSSPFQWAKEVASHLGERAIRWSFRGRVTFRAAACILSSRTSTTLLPPFLRWRKSLRRTPWVVSTRRPLKVKALSIRSIMRTHLAVTPSSTSRCWAAAAFIKTDGGRDRSVTYLGPSGQMDPRPRQIRSRGSYTTLTRTTVRLTTLPLRIRIS